MSSLTLYRLQACPFCERVVKVLQNLNLSYQSRFVLPMHSDRSVVKRITGARTVPVLIDDQTGAVVAESDTIVTYLQKTYGDR
ncbi:glutathione S-transferase N-terminal domain-containing protein [Salinarchaeum sp. IM2453]|uniref:glutathione S-transferase N-terminal domain-containing protein n=1 Tax=Salinarchaeum sp. IM2453 TaxID=2862870 RepID=UPI001C8409AC|nr:glutathione S-transferase N-terminal domain-containing protein [Salinarchaeum sp. IM2453]QZA88098.1 glutathione S-transferase N-terminal domain-containing protein [Salinarchaeum sp. IM2453]